MSIYSYKVLSFAQTFRFSFAHPVASSVAAARADRACYRHSSSRCLHPSCCGSWVQSPPWHCRSPTRPRSLAARFGSGARRRGRNDVGLEFPCCAFLTCVAAQARAPVSCCSRLLHHHHHRGGSQLLLPVMQAALDSPQPKYLRDVPVGRSFFSGYNGRSSTSLMFYDG